MGKDEKDKGVDTDADDSTKSNDSGDLTDEKASGNPDDMSKCEDKYKNLPPMSFTTLVLSLSTQVMMSLGDIPDPVTNEATRNIPLAKQSIDLLGILNEKTKGNLTVEEEKFLKASLTDLRIRFVKVCKKS